MASVRRDSAGDAKLQVYDVLGSGDPFTVTAWVNRRVDRNDWTGMWSVDSDSTARYIYVSDNGGGDFFGIWDGAARDPLVFDQPIISDQWYFLAVTYAANGTTFAYWKRDGDPALVVEGPVAKRDEVLMTHFQIFDTPWGGEWFNGSVTAVKMWNRVLSQAEIEAEMDQRPAASAVNLVGEWHLDGVSDWLDQSGNGNDLTGGAGLSTDADEPNDLAGVPPAQGSATYDGLGAFQAAGTGLPAPPAQGSATYDGLGTFQAAGTGIAPPPAEGTAKLDGFGTFQAAGAGIAPPPVQGSASLEGLGFLSALGAGIPPPPAQGSAAYEGLGSFQAAGFSPGEGAQANYLGLGGFQASGTGIAPPPAQGSAKLDGVGTFTAEGTGIAFGTAKLDGFGDLSATGTGIEPPPGQGAATLVGVGTFQASGGWTSPDAFATYNGLGIMTVLPVLPRSPRQLLADVLRVALGAGYQVLAAPSHTVSPPSVVVRPADPYQAPFTGHGAEGSAWAFEVDLIVPIWETDNGLDALDALHDTVVEALPAGFWWIDEDDAGGIEIGGKEYLRSVLGVATVAVDGITT